VSEFLGVALAFSVIRTRETGLGKTRRFACDVTIGNAEFVNVLKTTGLRYAAARRSNKRMFGSGRLALKHL
jgi:hypothetical protein